MVSFKKIILAKTLAKKILAFKKSGKKIVFTNGCFDLIHAGHIRTFQKAKIGQLLTSKTGQRF